MEFAFCHLACLCSNSAFCFSNSLFLSAVALSAARFRASPSSLVITPLSTKSSMRSFSSSPASSFFSCCSSIFSICWSYIPTMIEVSPSDIALILPNKSSIPILPSRTTFVIRLINPLNNVPNPSTALLLTFSKCCNEASNSAQYFFSSSVSLSLFFSLVSRTLLDKFISAFARASFILNFSSSDRPEISICSLRRSIAL